jgi:hypothetical protein
LEIRLIVGHDSGAMYGFLPIKRRERCERYWGKGESYARVLIAL